MATHLFLFEQRKEETQHTLQLNSEIQQPKTELVL